MYIEGFLRSLQGDFVVAVGALFAIALVYAVVQFATKQAKLELSEATRSFCKATNVALGTLVAFVLVIFFGRAVAMGFSNRMPRSDVDKAPVYEQMDGHHSGDESRPNK